jgi:Mg2+ and Co2+ transporter CorA
VLTAVTGFYGMNVPYPGSPGPPGWSPQWCLYLLFKRLEWL